MRLPVQVLHSVLHKQFFVSKSWLALARKLKLLKSTCEKDKPTLIISSRIHEIFRLSPCTSTRDYPRSLFPLLMNVPSLEILVEEKTITITALGRTIDRCPPRNKMSTIIVNGAILHFYVNIPAQECSFIEQLNFTKNTNICTTLAKGDF